MTKETLSEVSGILNTVLADSRIGDIMYRTRLPTGAPLLNEYREAVRIALAAVAECIEWREAAERIQKGR